MSLPLLRPPSRLRFAPVEPHLLRLLLLMVLTVVSASACRADATVSVRLGEDGSGVVEVALVLDDEAVEAVGGIDHQIRLEDLENAGWEVDGPQRSLDDGLTSVVATKGFEVPDRLPPILDEIAGPGVFTDMGLVRNRSFARTTWSLSGRVDLSGGLEAFSDPALSETLSGLPLGRTREELAELAGCVGCDPADMFSLELVVALPGEVVANADRVDEGSAVWAVALGDSTPTLVDVSGSVADRAPRLWLGASLTLASLLVVLGLFRLVRHRLGHNPLGRRVRHLPRPTRRRGRAAEIIEQRPPRTEESGEQRLQLVVLGGIGVVWDGGTDPEGLLVSFVREHGGIADPREVADRYRAASLGQVSAAEFWSAVGVVGDAADLDARYLSGVRLRPDVLVFLDQMHKREMTVGCLTNAVLPWTVLLRSRFDLDGLISHWVVSGEVGARKPGQAMFEALRRMSGVPFSNMLLIDSEIATLEAARTMGMSTVLMTGTALIPEGFAHPTVDSFSGLFRKEGGEPPDQ
ncbi:MAG: HAD-IA family hydrolase [Actinobacteria bacterium]|mgnify:FL=1|jgi:putative hydrolase of the HAD superfamily|nr:HAD-IA family hydrolase [Actinomycetota bacterium]MBT3686820.1 HAD-IA family hydrolase [Actinomycetota bacterium]MBT4037157.1 HAD-IA family hydrolase [Actinomycetota bacterium]MBT4278185.1 HAD-IA family hydrolase [Actinomycetota bacterium]MBT4343829.1 HAD-IA family hydrolase [Actinomycetota bacterium]